MIKLNNKGFTLVVLLAVLVILIAIMGIAIPTISSSLERTKDKQNKARYRILESAAEQYVTDNKNKVYRNLNTLVTDSCFINLTELSEYLSSDDMKDADGNVFRGAVIFTRAHTEGANQVPVSYKYENTGSFETKSNGGGASSYQIYKYSEKNGTSYTYRDCTS